MLIFRLVSWDNCEELNLVRAVTSCGKDNILVTSLEHTDQVVKSSSKTILLGQVSRYTLFELPKFELVLGTAGDQHVLVQLLYKQLQQVHLNVLLFLVIVSLQLSILNRSFNIDKGLL